VPPSGGSPGDVRGHAQCRARRWAGFAAASSASALRRCGRGGCDGRCGRGSGNGRCVGRRNGRWDGSSDCDIARRRGDQRQRFRHSAGQGRQAFAAVPRGRGAGGQPRLGCPALLSQAEDRRRRCTSARTRAGAGQARRRDGRARTESRYVHRDGCRGALRGQGRANALQCSLAGAPVQPGPAGAAHLIRRHARRAPWY
jgi:hypothetical protein